MFLPCISHKLAQMRPVTLRISLNERRELTLVSGKQLVAPVFRLMQSRDLPGMRLQLAGQARAQGGNIFFCQEG